jgi:hypothetical protein
LYCQGREGVKLMVNNVQLAYKLLQRFMERYDELSPVAIQDLQYICELLEEENGHSK